LRIQPLFTLLSSVTHPWRVLCFACASSRPTSLPQAKKVLMNVTIAKEKERKAREVHYAAFAVCQQAGSKF
jgi:hypothetical protein